MRRVLVLSIWLCLVVGLSACAGPSMVGCYGTQKPMLVAELLFGRNIGGRLGVSDAAWSDFLKTEITPRFPDGLTVLDGAGQWRDEARNRIVREPSKVVLIAAPESAETHARLGAIAEAYKRRFHQQSVGTVVRPACVSF